MTFQKFLDKLDYTLYPIQQEIVDVIDQNDTYNVIYKRRQEGISTVLSLYVIWKLIENPGISVALFTNKISGVNLHMFLSTNKKIFEVKTDSVNKTVLKNGSQALYYSFSSCVNDYHYRGHKFDMIILEDLFDIERFRINYNDAHNFISTVSRNMPINGKMIISTSEIPQREKDKLSALIIVQEIYGGFFNGKRKVLIEKVKHKKS